MACLVVIVGSYGYFVDFQWSLYFHNTFIQTEIFLQELISNTSMYVYYFVLDAKNKTCDICDSGLTKIELVNYLGTISPVWYKDIQAIQVGAEDFVME